MRVIVCFFVFIAVVGAGMSRQLSNAFTKPAESQTASVTAPSRKVSPPQQTSTGYRTVKLESDSHGHFRIDARVDGRSIDFMVDTGASAVVLRESAAAQLGIFPRASEWTGRSQTANGVAKYAPVRLNRIEVNGITVRDVDAAVMSDSALKVNLLGMTFLSRVKWSHDRGKLVLEQ
ncbi:MAG: aspartyl protease family protein [Alphaproteobacteria bacterium]|jgi:aspartyl protease family protein|nr:aspartyl protease family protein [Alphaproteobacteria bacterium]